MRIWPEGAWFGLTKRVMLWVMACSFAALLVCYCGLCWVFRSEAHKAAELIHRLSRVEIGDPEESLLPVIQRFELSGEGRVYTGVLGPLLKLYRLGHPFDWATFALPSEVRKKVGLRFFEARVYVLVEAHRVAGVSARVTVEGRDENLGVEWVLTGVNPFRETRS